MKTRVIQCWACAGHGAIAGCKCRHCRGVGEVDMAKAEARMARNRKARIRRAAENGILRTMCGTSGRAARADMGI